MKDGVNYQFEEDHIVKTKYVTAGSRGQNVTLYYYPREYDTFQGREVLSKEGEWIVEVGVGACYGKSFKENRETAELAYDLINSNFIASVLGWHDMFENARKYRSKFLDIFNSKLFLGTDMKNDHEKTNFDLNDKGDGKPHIHTAVCYVPKEHTQSGLAKINRALKSYHHNSKLAGDNSDSYVGSPHDICIIREKLQYLRFELL